MSLAVQVEKEQSSAAPLRGQKARVRDRVFLALSILGVLFLVFQAGVLVAVTKAPPYPWFEDGYQALESYLEQRELLAQTWPKYLWNPTERTERGLVRHDPEQTFPGYTLYTTGHAATAILLDMEGREVHRWTAPFGSVWPPHRQGSRSLPDRFVYMRRGVVYPNGDLLALYETPCDTPNGRGLAKLNRSSQVLWTYDAHTHHDLCVRDDGHLLVLAHRLQTVPSTGATVIEDLIVHLDEQGKEIETVSILELLTTTDLAPMDLDWEHPRGDLTHANTIQVIPPEFASHHPAISPGDWMVCLRNLNLVLAINPQRREIVWGTTGPWYFPHDPDPLPNGNLLIFDNYCVWGTAPGSAVIEFDPRTRNTVWSFRGDHGFPLHSDIRSCQQVLPNGNVLVTESDGGRILEVARAGRVVWEYLNPVRGGENDELIPILCGATRYAKEQLPFLEGDSASAAEPSAATVEARVKRKLDSQ